MNYALKNKPSTEFTASPDKYPQGKFKDKPCKTCAETFSPQAPSHLHCSDACAERSLTSRYLERNYGINIETYEAMLDEQNSLCKICGEEGFLMDKAKHKVKLMVDHCHETGKVRGLLCHNCNRALGLLKDDTSRLTAAIAYLERCNDYRESE